MILVHERFARFTPTSIPKNAVRVSNININTNNTITLTIFTFSIIAKTTTAIIEGIELNTI